MFYWQILPVLGIPFENNYNLTNAVLLGTFFLPNVMSKLYMPGGILEVLWSIGIEEQFYIIVAPLLFIINKHRILQTLLILTTVYFIVFHLEFFNILQEYIMVFFFLFFGGIIAILEDKKQLEFLKKSLIFPVLITVLTVLYFTTSLFEFESIFLFNLVTMVLFGCFIHSIAHNNKGIDIRDRMLNYFGQISYGIYMYHVIALNTVVFLFLKVEWLKTFSDNMTIILINILTFALTIFMAHLSYRYFETYFLKLKNKFRE